MNSTKNIQKTTSEKMFYYLLNYFSSKNILKIIPVFLLLSLNAPLATGQFCPGTCPISDYTETIINICDPDCAKKPETCSDEPNSLTKCQLLTFDIAGIAANCGVDISGCANPGVTMIVFQGCGQMSTSNISYYDLATCTGGMTGSDGVIALDLTTSSSYIVCSTSNNLSFGTISVTGCCDLTASATGTDVLCNGANNGSININPMNGTAPYTWAATSGLSGNGLTVPNLAPGNYVVTLTDANGCMAVTNPVNIGQPAALDAGCSRDKDVSCFGGSDGQVSVTAMNGTPPYTFQWGANAGNATTQVVGGLPAGLYSVTATDANGCMDICAAQVNQPASAIDAACARDKDASCFGSSDGQVSVSASGGTPPYSFQWGANAGNATTQVVGGLPAGLYSVTATDANGCMDICAAQVNQPASAIDAACARDKDASCFGSSDGQVSVSASGGTPPYSFQWGANAGNATSQVVGGLPAGLYSVTATDANGCMDICAAQVNQPTTVFDAQCARLSDASCFGASDGVVQVTGVGGTPPYSFQWGANAGNATTQVVGGLPAGLYSVTATDANGCMDICAAQVNNPVASIMCPNPGTFACGDDAGIQAWLMNYNLTNVCLDNIVTNNYNPADFPKCVTTTKNITFYVMTPAGQTIADCTTSLTINAAPAPTVTPPTIPGNITCDMARNYIAPDVQYSNGLMGVCGISGSIIPSVQENWDACGGTITVSYMTTTSADNCGHTLTAGPYTIQVSAAPSPTPTVPTLNTPITCIQADNFSALSGSYDNGETGVCNISGVINPNITHNWTKCGGTITVDYNTATDACWNPVMGGVQVIQVLPAPMATITPPAPFASPISCFEADNFSAPDVTYSNGVTGTCNISGSISASIDNSNWTKCGGTLIVTYSGMDECNRPLSLPPYLITVLPAPEATVTVPFVPGSLSCVDATNYSAPTASYSNGVMGTCNISGTIPPTVTPNFDKCGGIITITYGINPALTDECGRPITASRIILVQPAPAPTVFPPSFPSQVTCAEGDALVAPHAYYDNGISGTCNISGWLEANVVKNINACSYSNITVTYSGFDDCGNFLSAGPFTILVEPAPEPALVQPQLPMMINCWDAPYYDPGPLYYTNNESGVCERSGHIYPIVTPLWDGCDGGNILVKWEGADFCGYPLETQWYVVMVMPDDLAPVGECAPIAVNLTYLDDVPGPDELYDYKYQIANNYNDWCSNVVVNVVGDSGEQPCQLDGTFERIYQMEVADECGNVADTCEVRFYGNCNPLYCTLSQSFYGGQWENDSLFGYSSLEIIDSLIGFGEDSILIGSGNSSCGFILDDATCIRTIVSGHGTSYPLWNGYDLNCTAPLQNVLVNQIITTTLNVRYNALFNNGLDFGNFQLSAACQNLPNDLVADLPANATVNDLLDYANDFLACQCDGTCGNFDNFINHELTGIFLALNSRFHECHVPGPCTIVDDCFVVNDDNMIGLDAKHNGYKTKIDWTMLNDVEVDRYELERSVDGINFTNLGETLADQSKEARSYGFTDDNPAEGANFYRLKVFHKDGGFCYTDTRQVDIELPFAEVNLFPNPTNHRINLSVHGFVGKAGQVMIANNQGVVVREQSYNAIPENILQFDVQDYVSGMYWITIKVDGHKSVTKKFIVSKLDFQEIRN